MQHDQFIAQDLLLLGLLQDKTIEQIVKESGLSVDAIEKAVKEMRGGRKVESKNAESNFDALRKYAQDLTALAEEGSLDPVIGRDDEIRRVIRILCRRTKVRHLFLN